MKCTECPKWDTKNKCCDTGEGDPFMPPDQDIFCEEAGDAQEDYFPAEAKQ